MSYRASEFYDILLIVAVLLVVGFSTVVVIGVNDGTNMTVHQMVLRTVHQMVQVMAQVMAHLMAPLLKDC